MKNPNVVFILADDMGWGDPECNNPESQIPTPHMNKIADEGARLTRAYAASAVCSPSRYALLTGRYAWRTRMKEGVLYGYCRHLIEEGRSTLGSMFQGLGYDTACIGKWHVGMDWTPKEGDDGNWGEGTNVRRERAHEIGHRVDFTKSISNGPNAVGFDYFYGTAACPTCNSPNTFIENDRVETMPEWNGRKYIADNWDNRNVDDVFVDKAVAWMDEKQQENAEKPFFLYLPLSSPHAPYEPPERLEGQGGDGGRGEMVCWFDESVGKIDAALARMGIQENTLVIISSDNGGQCNDIKTGDFYKRLRENPSMTVQDLYDEKLINEKHKVNGPYRGFKTDIWDGGTRVAFLARWPQKIQAKTVCDDQFCLIDLLPSLAELFGGTYNKEDVEDGQARPQTLLGEATISQDRLVTHSYTGVFAFYRGPWKLIPNTLGSGGHKGVTPDWAFHEPDTDGQLYHLGDDPYEKNNRWHDPELLDLRHSMLDELQGIQHQRM